MNYLLENTFLRATLSTEGAELYSLQDTTNTEYIWSGDPTYWGRHTPILFPFVGRVKDGVYTAEGKQYTPPSHGFARDMTFEASNISPTTVTFSLYANDTTYTYYPYQFCLKVHYELMEKSLKITYEVINEDTKSIYFKIGAHPGFFCPLRADETMEDYYLAFEQNESAAIYGLTEDNWLDPNPTVFQGNTLPLSVDLFAKDAIIFKDLASKYVSICSKNHATKVHFAFENFPFFAVWSPATRSPFICLEPWVGHVDFATDSTVLAEKQDTICLPVGQNFLASHTITIEN